MPYDPLTLTSPPATIAANASTDLEPPSRPGDNRSPKEDRPDYTCDAYNDAQPYRQLCADVRAGTKRLRDRATDYLPRFEAESLQDWEARLSMTFVNDHYAQTLEDLVGLVCGEDVALDPKEAPPALLDLVDNIDGEGDALPVFARDVLEKAIDEGHSAILTEYPDTAPLKQELGRDLTLADVRAKEIRPYFCAYKAVDILSWRYAKMGSTSVLTKVVLRERVTKSTGQFGSAEVERYRIIEQATVLNAGGDVTALGAITFTVKEKTGDKDPNREFITVAEGQIVGPKRIPLRIVYGGTRLGRLRTRPFLLGLALTNIEEAQVQSDYSAVMHKCNVPTPIFIGRTPSQDGTMATIQMGQGIDIPINGDAKMLEPSGAALSATRDRLTDIRLQLRRQGATLEVDDARKRQLTATEAAITAQQRNAKLQKAARSLRDALEGAFNDMLAFLGIAQPKGGKVGVIVNTDFSSGSFDPIFVAACRDAYGQGALPLEAYLYVLKHGELPDDFDAEDIALRLLSETAATNDAAADPNADPNADPGDATDPNAVPPKPGATQPGAAGASGAGASAQPVRGAPAPADRMQPPAKPRPAAPTDPAAPNGGASPTPAPASPVAPSIDLSPLERQLQALATQVQSLAERVVQPTPPAPAAPAAAALPPELLALITAVMASLANRPGFPALTITKGADGVSKVEPTAPTPAAAA